MLEAKAKDQEHSRKCSPKKRSSKNFFQAISNLEAWPQFLIGWGVQTTNHMQSRHQKFSKEKICVAQRYHWMEDLKSLPVGT